MAFVRKEQVIYHFLTFRGRKPKKQKKRRRWGSDSEEETEESEEETESSSGEEWGGRKKKKATPKRRKRRDSSDDDDSLSDSGTCSISLLLLIEFRETLVAAVVAMYCEMAEMTFDFVKRMSEF